MLSAAQTRFRIGEGQGWPFNKCFKRGLRFKVRLSKVDCAETTVAEYYRIEQIFLMVLWALCIYENGARKGSEARGGRSVGLRQNNGGSGDQGGGKAEDEAAAVAVHSVAVPSVGRERRRLGRYYLTTTCEAVVRIACCGDTPPSPQFRIMRCGQPHRMLWPHSTAPISHHALWTTASHVVAPPPPPPNFASCVVDNRIACCGHTPQFRIMRCG
ncbi:hypothetical protein niasHS_016500 [Heterodera schachtii]|uniref:Uncharacterized protein n=1 Tax=Heterodera schachtii TaxID=97005 RepID=A0ABD2I341_HETSC